MSNLAKVELVAHPIIRQVDLAARVKSFAKPVTVLGNGHRCLPGGSAKNLLAGLLLEIDEAILPRQIKVMADTGRITHLRIGNRRLLDIQPAQSLESRESCSSADPGILLDHLNEALAGATEAEILVTRLAPEQCQVDKGCPAVALAAASAIVLHRQANPDPVPAFYAALKGDMIAWITLDRTGNCQKRGGEAGWVERLVDLSGDGLAEIDAQMVQALSAPDEPGCVILDFGGEGGFLLVYARSGSSGFAAILPASRISAAQTAWKTVAG
jgi:hypothetical protein